MPCLNKGNTTGGFFSVPLIFFSCIELLAILWKNPVEYTKGKKRLNFISKSHAEEAVQFIKKYLGRIRNEYKDYGGLLYGLYRHSLVHNYQPSVIEINNTNKIVSWEIGKNSNSKHLGLREEERNGKIYKILTINLDIFYEDIQKSINMLESDALKYKTIRDRILRADNKLNRLRPSNFLSKYIQNDLVNI